ncbi:MAG: cation:proton antiporter [Gemmatimonadaceae bacterium]
MNDLASLGVILLFALLVGHLVKFVRVPEVTGYLLAGMIAGPSVLGFVTHENLQALRVFSEVGLGLILFSIGSVFEFSRLKKVGAKVVGIAFTESAAVALMVFIVMIILGQGVRASVLLGAIAVSTGAASTLMVIRENNSAGPFTDTVTAVIGLNNIFALVLFSLVAGSVEIAAMVADNGVTFARIAATVFPLLWELAGSAALGFLVGLMLASWASQVKESGEVLILLIGCVLLTVGLASAFDLSPLIASLAVGATMANLSSKSRKLFEALSRTDPPLYVIFFVLAGADLNLRLLPSLGMIGAAYVGARTMGKIGGAWFGARRAGLGTSTERLLGFAILAQAGLAVGLVLIARQRFPDIAQTITAVVLGSVVIFEIFGPLGARIAIGRSGESRRQDDDLLLP